MKQITGATIEQKDVLKYVLENVNPNDTHLSITVKDLRQIDKICKVIESSNSSLSFEDADFAYLKNKFDHFTNWNPLMRKIVLEVAELLDTQKGGD